MVFASCNKENLFIRTCTLVELHFFLLFVLKPCASLNTHIIFLNTGEQYVLKFFMAKALWSNPGTIEWLNSISEYIQDSGIEKKKQLKLIDLTDYSEKQVS